MTKTPVAQICVTRTRSSIAAKPMHRETLRTLGLRKIGDSVIREDNPVNRGLVRAVAHMVIVEEVK